MLQDQTPICPECRSPAGAIPDGDAQSPAIHRRITWQHDTVAGYNAIVCGAEPANAVASSLPSGYNCPECLAQTPQRQLRATLAGLIVNTREIGAPPTVVALLEQAAAAWQPPDAGPDGAPSSSP